jgi:membrane protein required for colicin V production
MSWVDLVILAIIGVSVVISVWRGFVKEAFSLVGWVAAIWLGRLFVDDMQDILSPYIGMPLPRIIVAFSILAISTLIISGILSHLFSQFIEFAKLGGADKVVAVFFGAIRGYLVVAVIALIVALFGAARTSPWQESALMPLFEDIVIWMADFLPSKYTSDIHL